MGDLPEEEDNREVKHLFASFLEAREMDPSLDFEEWVRQQPALRSELHKANFSSVRGDFRFGNNHFPIQDFYAREVVVDSDGNWTTSATGVALEDHQDVYAAECDLS